MTSYFKFLEWWLLPCDPYREGSIPLGQGTVDLENALVGNIETRYAHKCTGKYPRNWLHSWWDRVQWM
jgi:hypothetical protein